MKVVQIILWTTRIAGMGAFVLGLFIWFTHIRLISAHILLGLILALSLLTLSIVMVCTKGVRLLGTVGIVYALILPAFGLKQSSVLIGTMHWLIQAAHLLVGIGAVVVAQMLFVHYRRLRLAGVEEVPSL